MKTAAFLSVIIVSTGVASAADTSDFFETRVRPVFAKNCYACHTDSKMGGLRLDSADSVKQGGKSGPPIVPGKPEESLLIQAIRQTHERIKMPPSGKLKEQEIADIAEWIKSGAVWPAGSPASEAKPAGSDYVITAQQRAFWSFQPVRKPPVPAVKDNAFVRNPIDNFVLAKLESQGLKPTRPADKRILIRRASIDLIGLPPTPEEVDAFVADKSPNAFAKVVDRLLESPHYGERWGRYWLDVARYSDDKLNSTQEELHPNAFRYRDWVIQAFNSDMPYDIFAKAQIAGDFLPSDDPLHYRPALGFYALSPEMQDERVDATTRGFLGLTVACAQCHNHKFDPIPTKDYYSLQGIFTNTQMDQHPLAPKDVVDAWDAQKKALDKLETRLKDYISQQTVALADILASQAARYMLASRHLGPADGLDPETLERWTKYLSTPKTSHSYLKPWFDLVARNAPPKEFEAAARDFQKLIEEVSEEKKTVDQKNLIKLGLNPSRNDQSQANLDSLPIEKYSLYREIFEKSQSDAGGFTKPPDGVLYYGDGKIDRFLSGEWKRRLDALRAEVAEAKKALPPQYPFLQTVKDKPNPQDIRVAIRGDVNNRGEVAPRHFVSILCQGEPKKFTQGSGRLELAEAIADPQNPLTARVMVNRIWMHHFGRGIVETPSNFGEMGARPSNPELLDYLAARLVENKWSIKAMHREIMLSAVYQLSTESVAANEAADPDNRMLWRANWQRLDAEALRDSLLFVAGSLDTTAGGPPVRFGDENHRRAVYGFTSRRKPDPTMALFDFPTPNSTVEQRIVTNVPLQRLFLMNSSFVEKQAQGLAQRLNGDDTQKVRQAYRILYGRLPSGEELDMSLTFLRKNNWNEYARVLLNSNEFLWIN
jgi:mono/diheme cytochrome c family protein